MSLPEYSPMSLTVSKGQFSSVSSPPRAGVICPAKSPALAPAGPSPAWYLRHCPLLEEVWSMNYEFPHKSLLLSHVLLPDLELCCPSLSVSRQSGRGGIHREILLSSQSVLSNCLKSLLLLNCQNRVRLLLRWLHLLTTLISLNLLATVFCRELFVYLLNETYSSLRCRVRLGHSHRLQSWQMSHSPKILLNFLRKGIHYSV